MRVEFTSSLRQEDWQTKDTQICRTSLLRGCKPCTHGLLLQDSTWRLHGERPQPSESYRKAQGKKCLLIHELNSFRKKGWMVRGREGRKEGEREGENPLLEEFINFFLQFPPIFKNLFWVLFFFLKVFRFFYFILFFVLCVWVLCLSVCMWPTSVPGARGDQRIRSPGTRAADGYKLPCGRCGVLPVSSKCSSPPSHPLAHKVCLSHCPFRVMVLPFTCLSFPRFSKC